MRAASSVTCRLLRTTSFIAIFHQTVAAPHCQQRPSSATHIACDRTAPEIRTPAPRPANYPSPPSTPLTGNCYNLCTQLESDPDQFHPMLESKGVSSDRPVVVRPRRGSARVAGPDGAGQGRRARVTMDFGGRRSRGLPRDACVRHGAAGCCDRAPLQGLQCIVPASLPPHPASPSQTTPTLGPLYS
jgi:hypothetical protein